MTGISAKKKRSIRANFNCKLYIKAAQNWNEHW